MLWKNKSNIFHKKKFFIVNLFLFCPPHLFDDTIQITVQTNIQQQIIPNIRIDKKERKKEWEEKIEYIKYKTKY